MSWEKVVPIIEIPGNGQTSAKLMCEKLKIKSCKEADKLKKAKEEVRQFYSYFLVTLVVG